MDTYTVDLESMGKRIRELRNTQNKTQEVFADMIHISSSYLALIEQGKRTASLDVVAQIAYTCHVSVDYLLFGSLIKKKNTHRPDSRIFSPIRSCPLFLQAQ